jgi:uncharacterized protein (TIGR02145 family)
VSATGSNPLSYQWYVGGTAISGATSSSYSIPNVQAANAGNYTVTISNGTLPNATSNGAVLTVAPNTVTDIDGNIYNSVIIGTKVWMAENLKTTKFNDGTAIPLVTDPAKWNNLTTPGYCWYNDSSIYRNTYGALYNWYAASIGNLAPTGWHVATDSEWNMLGGQNDGGGLKEAGTTHWGSPNSGATNATGFSALPGGFRANGAFSEIGAMGYWWSSTAYNTTEAYYFLLSSGNAYFNSFNSGGKMEGFSVRCVKD